MPEISLLLLKILILGLDLIEVAIDRYRPDVVIVDALYLIRPDYPRGALWEQVKNVSDNLKRISVYYKIPVFTSTQFNRSVLSATEIDPAYVAYAMQ